MKPNSPAGSRMKALAIMLCAGVAVTGIQLFAQNTPAPAPQAAPAAQTQPAQGQPGGRNLPAEADLSGWRVTDFEPYVKALKDLEKLNKSYSESVLNLAFDEYSTGIDILGDMENKIIKLQAAHSKKNNLNEQWYWQETDRKNQEKKQIAQIKFEAKMKSVTHFTRAITFLDDVQSLELRKDPKFIAFQMRLYQVYVSTQYDLNNLKPCIPILERYIALNDKTKNDVIAYKYLASCYGFMEQVLAKYHQASDDVIFDYRQKKNRALLMSAELKYGVESPQYKQLKEIVELDEKKTQQLNDFK